MFRNIFMQRRRFRPRRCPHASLRGLYGDTANRVGGWRLQCRHCWSFLDGPVSLANVDRDPDKLL